MPTKPLALRIGIFLLAMVSPANLVAAKDPVAVPDFTRGAKIPKGAKHDWNLGATGLCGWIYCDKMVTTDVRQILITKVDKGSPAADMFQAGDVILGVGGTPFSFDPRTELGRAITTAESKAGAGKLALSRWRAGKTDEVELRLPVLGSYSATAPFDCDKSKLLLEAGCKALAARMAKPANADTDAIPRSLNALALLASGNPEYLPLVKNEAQWAAGFSTNKMQTWYYGYCLLFLSEYVLATGDESVMPGVKRLALAAAKGQSAVGSWGHGFAIPDGRLAGYGMMNSPGLVLTISLVLAREAGVKDAEVALAIELSAKLLRFYIGKGAIPYGDHHAWTETHDDNGKCGMGAVLFNLLGEAKGAEFFSRLSVASHGSERDCGHTGNYFNMLWAMPGVALSGPESTGAWMKEFGTWYFDLARHWNGSYPHQGPPENEHDSYEGWDASGGYLLAYAMPLKKLRLTGSGKSVVKPLDATASESVIVDGRGWNNKDRNSAYDKLSGAQLVERLGSWSPVVRERAAMAIGRRKETPLPAVLKLFEASSLEARYGACQAVIALGSRGAPALEALKKCLTDKDLWLRVKAAEALAKIGPTAKPTVPKLLEMLAEVDPVNDPRGMQQRYLTFALFDASEGGMLGRSLDGVDREALYKAVRAGLKNQDGRARGSLSSVYRNLSAKDIKPLLPAIYRAILEPAPSGEMFADAIRVEGLRLLAKHRVEDGILACVRYAREQNPWESQIRTPDLMKILLSYGTHAKAVIPELTKLETYFEKDEPNFPKHLMRVKAKSVRDTIRAIENATETPDLIKLDKEPGEKKPGTDPGKTKPSAKVPLDDWKHSGTLTLLTTPDGANLPATAVVIDFPVLVRLHRDWFEFAQARSDGADVRFSTAEGVLLAHQIEEWDAKAGTASVWVRVPTIKGNSRQALRMHWGNADAPNTSDGKAVFNESNGYLSVWHMGETVRDDVGTLTTKDVGTTPAKGVIGTARHFDGKARVECGDKIATYPTGDSPHTTEVWFRPEVTNSTLIGWGNEKPQGKVVMQFRGPPHIRMDCYFSGANVESEGSIRLNEWTHVAHVCQKGDSRLYVNGVLVGTSARKDSPLKVAGLIGLWIGNWYGGSQFKGDVDEVRVSRVARSADGMRLQFENQKPMQTLVGPLVSPGNEFSVKAEKLTVTEGGSVRITAQAGGAEKVYWSLVRQNEDELLAVDRLTLDFSPGRVAGDTVMKLRLKAVFPTEVKTRDIDVMVKEAIPDPEFTLKVPAEWDGRKEIVFEPQITNLAALKAARGTSSDVRMDWSAGPLAVIAEVTPGKLRLLRAQNSGTLTVTATLSNGGRLVSQSSTIVVKEPATDPWVPRVADKDEKPEEGQFYARDDRNEGALHYNGTLDTPADEVFLKVYCDDKPFAAETAKPGKDMSYALAAKLKPGLVKYRVEFGTRSGGTETVLHKVGNLLCGDAFLIEGQSNAEALDLPWETPRETSEWVRTYGGPLGRDTDGEGWVRERTKKAGGKRPNLWFPAVWKFKPPEHEVFVGWWGMELGKRLVESQKVPVCLINGALGGTRIDQHQRNPRNPADLSTIYGRWLWRLQQAKLTHGIRAVIWHQGENDQPADGPSGDYGWKNYHHYFIEMSAGWKRDLPNVKHYYAFQIWPDSCAMGGKDGAGDRLREQQRTLSDLFSNLSVMSTLGVRPPGGCHFPKDGYTEFARLLQPLIERDIYGKKPSKSITPPNLKRVAFPNAQRDTLTLEFDQPVVWKEELSSQFFLDGTKGQVASGSVQGAKLTLKLKAPSTAKTITYLKEVAWNQGMLLVGENGIAALTFCEVPVATPRR